MKRTVDALKCNLGNQGLCYRASLKADAYSPETRVKLLPRILELLWEENLTKFPCLTGNTSNTM